MFSFQKIEWQLNILRYQTNIMYNFPLIFQRKRRNSLCRCFLEISACYEDTNRYFSATTTHNAYICCTMGLGDSWSKQLGKNYTTPAGEKSQFLPLSTVGEATSTKPQHLSADPVLPQGYRLTSCQWEATSSLPFRHPSRGAHHLPTGSAFLRCLICTKPPRRDGYQHFVTGSRQSYYLLPKPSFSACMQTAAVPSAWSGPAARPPHLAPAGGCRDTKPGGTSPAWPPAFRPASSFPSLFTLRAQGLLAELLPRRHPEAEHTAPPSLACQEGFATGSVTSSLSGYKC